MVRRCWLIWLLSSAYLVIAQIANGAEPASSYTPPTWIRVETDNFVIYSDRNENETFRQVSALEQFRLFMGKLLPDNSKPIAEEKLTLFLLRSQDELDVARPGYGSYVSGVFFFCEDGQSAFSAHIPLSVRAAKVFANQDQSQLTLFHEYTHYLMARKGLNQYPLWYEEGLADYYSTLTYDGTRFAVGTIPYDNNLVLNKLSWSDFETVLDPDRNFSSGLAVRGTTNLALFYARAWLLTHYMMSDSGRRAQLEDYFTRLRRGEPSMTAFKAATGIEPANLAGILRAYSKSMPIHVEEAGDIPTFSGDVEGLEDAHGAFVYQAAVLSTCPSSSYGAALLNNIKLLSDKAHLQKIMDNDKSGPQRAADIFALNLAPQIQADPDYMMAIALGEILYGDPTAPRATLSAIGPDDARYVRAQYLLGRSYLKAADNAAPDAVADLRRQAESHLRVAVQAMPDSGPAHYFLARSLEGITGREDEAFDLAQTAMKLLPSVFDYGSYTALLDIRAGRRDDAIAILGQYDNDPHNFDRNKLIADVITAVKAGKSAEAVQTLLQPPQPDKNKPK